LRSGWANQLHNRLNAFIDDRLCACHLLSVLQGTDFMTELAQWLRDWAADKAATDPRFKHTAFIISGIYTVQRVLG
jgi:hypothetical protein